eukprot:Awhi_evm1s508
MLLGFDFILKPLTNCGTAPAYINSGLDYLVGTREKCKKLCEKHFGCMGFDYVLPGMPYSGGRSDGSLIGACYFSSTVNTGTVNSEKDCYLKESNSGYYVTASLETSLSDFVFLNSGATLQQTIDTKNDFMLRGNVCFIGARIGLRRDNYGDGYFEFAVYDSQGEVYRTKSISQKEFVAPDKFERYFEQFIMPYSSTGPYTYEIKANYHQVLVEDAEFSCQTSGAQGMMCNNRGNDVSQKSHKRDSGATLQQIIDSEYDTLLNGKVCSIGARIGLRRDNAGNGYFEFAVYDSTGEVHRSASIKQKDFVNTDEFKLYLSNSHFL